MKRCMTGILIGIMALVSLVEAVEVSPRLLGVNEQAGHMGANIAVTVDYTDFTTTTTNAAQSLTWDITAGDGWCMTYIEVVKAFNAGAVTNEMKVAVGDSTEGSVFIADFECGVDSVLKGGWGTGIPAGKFYTTADNLKFTFSPTGYALTDLTSGQVIIYLKQID